MKLHVLLQDVTIGRQIFEEEVYYTFPPSHEAKQILNRFMHKTKSPEEQEVFTDIVRIQTRKRTSLCILRLNAFYKSCGFQAHLQLPSFYQLICPDLNMINVGIDCTANFIDMFWF